MPIDISCQRLSIIGFAKANMECSIYEMLQLALEKANSNQISESISSYQKVLSLDPQNATALFCLGVLYAQIGY